MTSTGTRSGIVETSGYAGGELAHLTLGESHLRPTKYATNARYGDRGSEMNIAGCRIVPMSFIDSILKGTSGEALQNTNPAYRSSEMEGLQ